MKTDTTKKTLPKTTETVTIEEILQQSSQPKTQPIEEEVPAPHEIFGVDELDRLTNENNDLKKQIQNLDDCILQLKIEITRMQSEVSTITIAHDRNVLELRSTRADLAAMKKGSDEKSGKIEILITERDRLANKIKTLRHALADL